MCIVQSKPSKLLQLHPRHPKVFLKVVIITANKNKKKTKKLTKHTTAQSHKVCCFCLYDRKVLHILSKFSFYSYSSLSSGNRCYSIFTGRFHFRWPTNNVKASVKLYWTPLESGFSFRLNNWRTMNFIFTTAAGPFAAELMSDADAEVCSNMEYCSALGDSVDPVGTSRSSEVDFLWWRWWWWWWWWACFSFFSCNETNNSVSLLATMPTLSCMECQHLTCTNYSLPRISLLVWSCLLSAVFHLLSDLVTSTGFQLITDYRSKLLHLPLIP